MTTTPTYPADEIVHLDAIGQRIMPGDVVWASSSSSGNGARLVVKLTEHKVWVDKSSPKDACSLLVITSLLKSSAPNQYSNLKSRFGANIVTDVKSKASSAPLRFMVVSHQTTIVDPKKKDVSHISIHEVRGNTNSAAEAAIDAANALATQEFGDTHTLGTCLWKKPQMHNIGYDRTTHQWIYENRDWNWCTASASYCLLTIKRLEEAGIVHLPTNELIPVDQFNMSVSADRFKHQ